MNHGEMIELNGRTYTVLDVGEGHCNVVIVDDLVNWMSALALPTNRFLAVDASRVMKDVACDVQRAKRIAEDIRLLLDVYWLDEATIKCQINHLDTLFIDDMLAQRAYARELRYR